MNDYEDLHRQGIDVQTVGHLLDSEWGKPAPPVVPPILPGARPFPEPGIYFDMPEEEYHAIHCASASGLKRLSVSSMDYWAESVLNPEKEESDSKYRALGKAYHKRILEGAEAYQSCYTTQLDQSAFDPEKLLVSADQIKNAIRAAGHKPTTTGFNDVTVKAKKQDWIDQLSAIDPTALIWDQLLAQHEEENEGKTIINKVTHHRVEIANRMIEAHPEIGPLITRGWPEVSIFWHCPLTGAPMKMRADYLKLSAIVDLKSFSNQVGMPIDRAIEKTIANYRYNLQHVIYEEGVTAARILMRAHGASVVHGDEAQVTWALKMAQQKEPPQFIFIFQQTGNAPVTRGKRMPRELVFSTTKRAAETLKRRWVECAQTFGVDPWLDIEPINDIEDESIPLYATEF